MSSEHGLGLADNLEELLVESGLHDAVVVLDDQRVLLVARQRLRDQLHILNLIAVEAPAKALDVESCLCLVYLFAISGFGGHEVKVATKDEESLLINVGVVIA